MQLLLAPMEGVVTARMRALLTRLGGIDRCVTEFVRVTDQLLPRRVFLRYCPELNTGGATPSGVPVYLQLLGSNPQMLAANARRAATMGAPGIDLNFGCPAKIVNRHRGGSILLREPHLLHDIVSAVRNAVPPAIPVTVKMRLGYSDHELLEANARAIAEAGANELVIHARTRDDGYKPPAYWQHLAPLAEDLAIPLVANGEVWKPADYWRCRAESGCSAVMLGRGLLAKPDLARMIRQPDAKELTWDAIRELLSELFEDTVANSLPRHAGGPLKQWLGYLRRNYIEAEQLFSRIKRLTTVEDLRAALLADHKSDLISAPCGHTHIHPSRPLLSATG